MYQGGIGDGLDHDASKNPFVHEQYEDPHRVCPSGHTTEYCMGYRFGYQLDESSYKVGYEHGIRDGSGNSTLYLEQPGKGFEFHTNEFVNGYVAGFCSIVGKGSGSDSNAGTFTCP
ncbi:MAG TPA: hypothetical protein VEL11_10520 [Candidatus Bathyarchaeia archaeon]|nr:hypothetical protein [Candidatus Bathyarchaeia archaeon]